MDAGTEGVLAALVPSRLDAGSVLPTDERMNVPTVLVVPVPEAEEATRQWRRKLTKGGRRGMPSHITIVSPWVPCTPTDFPLARLESAIASISPFEFHLAELGTFPQGVLFVAPTVRERFLDLIEAVCAEFPEHQPYGGEFAPRDVVPHLTVAVSEAFPNGIAQTEEAIFKAATAAVEPQLPIHCVARELQVMYDDGAAWQVGPKVPLA